jgi:hypothetical protein
MVGADAEAPSVQSSASVVFGVVMKIVKLIVRLIWISLTVYGLYKNRCRSASVVFGVVMEIVKLMVPLICITMTVYGLYKNRCRPRAVQPQASSSPDSSTPPPTEAMG